MKNTSAPARSGHTAETKKLPPSQTIPRVVKAATRYDVAAWILLGVGLLITISYHLISALLAGLFVYSLVHRITRHPQEYRVMRSRAKMAALLLVSAVLVAFSTGLVILLIAVVQGRVGNVPELLHKMSVVVENFRDGIKSPSVKGFIPEAENLHAKVVEWLHENSRQIREFSSLTARVLIHSLLGIVIGSFLCFYVPHPAGPLAEAFKDRIGRFLVAFEKVVFAQIKISAVNTLLTGIYLFVILPLFGCRLHLRSTMLAVTFICGLLPVVGNLISNSVIVLLSFDLSSGVAVGSLVFLVLVHKLEYFLNARIIGGQIESAAWEILIVMLFAEALFGIPGVIMAPVVYAYIKRELMDYGLL